VPSEPYRCINRLTKTFNRKNINTSGEGALRRFWPLIARARGERLPVRGYVSTAFWCAFEGKISPETIVGVVKRRFDIGVEEVSVSDTIGRATPQEVSRLLDRLLAGIAPERVAVHFHDTYGRGVENVLTSWSYGIRIFDASCGGIGGCPFAPGATGNVATESVVKALENKGETVGVDLAKLSQAGRLLAAFLKEEHRTLPEGGSHACTVCEFYQGDVCCGRRKEPK
jgi:hydroxymethylglutaryl-CoA lyase